MLITNHVLCGAVVGSMLDDPVTAFGVGFGSHFVLDAVPHFGLAAEHLMKIAVPDGLLGLAAIGVIATRTPPASRMSVLAGIAGACVPDLDKPGRQFFGRSPFPGWFDVAHSRIQSESCRRWPVELVAASLLTAALSRRSRRRRAPGG
ncbi:MAG: hypothetical protein ACRDP1_16555 [Nocardioidaceae bacterium]